MMDISPDQAAEIYAKVMQARFGPLAAGYAKETIAELAAKRDVDGMRMWLRVLDYIEANGSD